MVSKITALIKKIQKQKKRLNQRMEGKYSPGFLAMIASAVALLLVIIMLFLPSYLGVADDGSVSRVMNTAGVYYLSEDINDNYSNYFVRVYANVRSGYQQKDNYYNSQTLFVKAAVWLDNLCTRDKYFDIRFLGLIYSICYIPAVYLLVKQACFRVRHFSEGLAILVVGIVIFTDCAYITYFHSFYPEGIWFISLMYCMAAVFSFQESRSGKVDVLFLILFCVSGVMLVTSRRQCVAIGFVLALYCLKLMFHRKNWIWSMLCVICAFGFSVLSIFSMVYMEEDFTKTSKFHAMTRGVLYGSDHPVNTLQEFGIHSSYEMLTDASAYDYLPFVKPDDSVIQEGFLDQYTTGDIGVYYMRHPVKFLKMLDLSIQSCFGIRREFCGNYEQKVGLPAKARSIFWSAWSTFKNNSAPKTIGYLFLLIVAAILLFGRKPHSAILEGMIILTLICFLQGGITVIHSGEAEMIQHCFLITISIDIMTYFVFAELVHKMKIF